MIARGFKSVIWVATVGGAALCCYMVSLKVATERAELAKVERQIVDARRDIRTLQTELGTRGRLSQLEQWNAEVLALSAPTSAQFLRSEVTLARFEQNEPTLEERGAEVRMASAEAPPAAAKPAAPVLQAVAPAQAGQAAPVVRRASFATADLAAQKPLAEAKPAKDGTAAGSNDAAAAKAKPPAAQAKAQAKALPVPAPAKQETKASAKAPPAKATATAAKKPADKPRASKIDSRLASEIQSGSPQGSGGN